MNYINNIAAPCCNNPCMAVPLHMLSGYVAGLPSVRGVAIEYTMDGKTGTVMTNPRGFYSLMVPQGESVTLWPTAVEGYTHAPSEYVIVGVRTNREFLNFNFTALT